MPSAQTRPRSGREEGCDFSVLRGRGGSPEKPERVQTSGSAPALPLGTWGLKIRGAGSAAQPGEWRSGALGQPLPLGLRFPECIETWEATPSGSYTLGPWEGGVCL